MSAPCPTFAPQDLVEGLQSINCVSAGMVTQTYGQLFGQQGALSNVLTTALTLYIAWIGLQLMLGRGGLSLAGLSGRTLKLGVILTFTTSWSAYQIVVLNLAWSAPDHVASLITGTRGDAMLVFADQLDAVFSDITELASAARSNGDPAGVRSAELLFSSGFVLMISTAGSLLAGRLVLAVLLASGPLFLVFALFGATRGVFVGWLRAVGLFALTSLFSVLLGFLALRFLLPVIDEAVRAGGAATSGTAALVLFVVVLEAFLMLVAVVASWLIVSGITRLSGPGQTPAPASQTVSAPSAEAVALKPSEHLRPDFRQEQTTSMQAYSLVERPDVSMTMQPAPAQVHQQTTDRAHTGLSADGPLRGAGNAGVRRRVVRNLHKPGWGAMAQKTAERRGQ